MTLKEYYKQHSREIDRLIRSALKEDNVRKDVTAALMLPGKAGGKVITAALLCKESCILSGIEVYKQVFRVLNNRVTYVQNKKDGDILKPKDIVLKINAPIRTLLSGERTALNFLQRMSGIASLTNGFVKRLSNRSARILHTRKTTPNFRIFEIAAVKTGGGDFHRYDLSSAVMIKDNHISAGDLEKTLKNLKNKRKSSAKFDRFEVEVKNFFELETVLKYGSDFVQIVMLDNFKPGDVEQAAEQLHKYKIKVEISGRITPDNFDKYQNRYVDFYSIGMLTHSYKSADFSLEF